MMAFARAAALLLLFAAPLRAVDLPTNTEMTALFTADQADRSKGLNIDWSVVAPADNVRRARTQALLDAGALQSADDYYHAAFVFQHGNLADDYLKAHLLAMVAVARGKAEGNWIAAASLDRYLRAIGQPQVLGTQFMIDGTKATQQPYASTLIPDSLRTALGVPVLSQQEEQRLIYEKRAIANPQPTFRPITLVPPHLYSWAPKAGAVACRTTPGAQTLLGQKALKWIVVGEQIGTQETPEMFADLVCQLSEQRPIAVALSISENFQGDIDAYIASDGGDQAKTVFKASLLWHAPIKDGLSSQGYFRLFERLRGLREAKRITAVIAYQALPPVSARGNPGETQKSFANALLARAPADGVTMVLSGKYPAMRVRPASADPADTPMAAYLPAASTITLDAMGHGGTYWACTSPTDCGVKTLPAASNQKPRGLELTEDNPAYSGVLNVGVPLTSSPPS